MAVLIFSAQRLIAVILIGVLWFGYWRVTSTYSDSESWAEVQGKNFIVYYEAERDQYQAQKLLRAADRFYKIIGEDIGYSRIIKFWTWDERVKIFLFKSRDSFLQKTGQPAWSTGYADRDHQTFKSKTIMTYTQEERFLDEILPHEISHLILHDYISPSHHLPKWFDEGVAQLQEVNKRIMARKMMRQLLKQSQFIPFDQMFNIDIQRMKEVVMAELFYVQSLSVVDFLEVSYGNEAFSRLCRELRDGKSFDEAMITAYSGIIKNRQDLENKWKIYVNR